jgi:hypothetical protein
MHDGALVGTYLKPAIVGGAVIAMHSSTAEGKAEPKGTSLKLQPFGKVG